MLTDTLAIKLEIYEGPLELLLHLIKKNEVELDHLPLALITAQYLEYLEAMEALNLEVASEFLLMAATLIHLKSAAVLPWPQDEEGQVEEERRRLLLEPLLEYVQAKALAEALRGRTQLGRDVFSRVFRESWPNRPLADEPDSGPLVEASVILLVEAFKRLAQRKTAAAVITFQAETKTIEERLLEARAMLTSRLKITFTEFCRADQSRADLILSFLAMLELAKTGFLICRQTLPADEIWLILAEGAQ